MRSLIPIALAACGHPAVHLDVVVTQDLVLVTASDPAVRDSPLFVHPGSCGSFASDDPGCLSDCPGDWIARVRLETAGVEVGAGDFHVSFGAATIGSIDTTALTDATVVIEGDGDEVRIAIPSTPRPAPAIDAIDTSGGDVAITWHSDPVAASTDLSISDALAGQFCHVGAGAGTKVFADAQARYAGITAYAPPTTTATDFGDAEVWVGATVATQ